MTFPAWLGDVVPFLPQGWKVDCGPEGSSQSVVPGRGETDVVVLGHSVPTPLYRMRKFQMICEPFSGIGKGMPGSAASSRFVPSLLSLAAPAAFFRMFASIQSGYPALRWDG